jgi:hypothetical protein
MPEFMGKRKCEFCRGAADEVWIPGVASRHRVALMQELNIHRVRAQSDYAKPTRSESSFSSREKIEGMELLGNRPVSDTALAGNQESYCQSFTTLWFCGRA